MEAKPLPEINDGRTTYDRWLESEQVKLVGGYYIPDLNELELDWRPHHIYDELVFVLKGRGLRCGTTRIVDKPLSGMKAACFPSRSTLGTSTSTAPEPKARE